MLPNKLLVRTARHLRKAWRQVAVIETQQLDNALDRLEQRYFALHQLRRRLDKLRREAIPPSLKSEVSARILHLREASDAVQSQVEQTAGAGTVPAVRVLLEELRQIDADIGGLAIDFDNKSITAVTEPITLEDIYLGPFAIRFFWDRLERSMNLTCFDIVALESNPAGADDRVTHPHVRDEKLCAGDATAPIKK